MGRRLWLGLCVSCLLLMGRGVASLAAAPGDEGVGRRIVVFAPGYDNTQAQAEVVRAAGGAATRALRLAHGQAALLTPAAERKLLARPEIARIDVDGEVQALGKPGGPGGKPTPPAPPQVLPWGVDRIDAEWAWSASRGAGVKVAILDTGLDRTHPDLAANIAGGVNFVAKNWWAAADATAWNDDNGHGSHVGGIIAGVDNEIGVVGVAPEASLYGVKVLNKSGVGYDSWIIAGLEWAVDNGMDVVNMSLGSDSDDPSLQEACDAAAAAGVILVAAAGNDGGAVDYPGAYDSVIAVAATNASDQVASWSSRGPEVDLAAPGVSVFSCWKNGGFATVSGTSMATPHVVGAIALRLSADPLATADDLLTAGRDNLTGWGLVDAGEIATGVVDYGDD